MQVVAVAAPDPETTESVVHALTTRLAERGSVGVLRADPRSPVADADSSLAQHRDAGAAETHALAADGTWRATGSDSTLSSLLDRYAPVHDYAVVAGFSDASLPAVVVGDREFEGRMLATAPTPEELEFDAVLDAIDDADPYVTLHSLVADVKTSPRQDRAGAIATFTGRVRAFDDPADPEDAETTHLEFEKYDDVADARMHDIRADLEARDGVLDVRLHHRTGVVDAGEDIVFVVVLAGHRREAFRAVEDGIDRLKAEVPLFKKEVTVADAFWTHDRP
jgi:molybdopterin synthase catalytic subunit